MKRVVYNKIKKENVFSYQIEAIIFDNKFEVDRFIIPVIDVRDGNEARGLIKDILKQNNFSRFTKPSFSVIGKSYQVSHKKI